WQYDVTFPRYLHTRKVVAPLTHLEYVTQDFFFSSRRRHTRSKRDWSSDVCSSDLNLKDRKPRTEDDRQHEFVTAVGATGRREGSLGSGPFPGDRGGRDCRDHRSRIARARTRSAQHGRFSL